MPTPLTTTVRFGESDSCELALGDAHVLAPVAAPHALLDDPAAAIRAALAHPQGYPPLAAATVPGDRVAIAVGLRIPCPLEILRGVLAALGDAGVDPQLVTVVAAAPVEGWEQLAAEPEAAGVSLVVHDADDENMTAMVGTTSAGRPLRFNRALAEADLVIPLAAGRLPAAGHAAPPKFGSLFPLFSNRQTQERFQSLEAGGSPAKRDERTAEIDEAGWLLGVGMTAGVVAGPGGRVAAVVVGEPALVARETAERYQAIWQRSADRPGDLVIAALTGDEGEQTWENVARAIRASGRVLSPDGAIAVCSSLEAPPQGAFQQLTQAVDLTEAQRHLRRDASPAARSARILAQALERGPVYLRSRLPGEVVEAMGITPLDDDDQLARLAVGREHCVVIEEAQRVAPQLVGRERGAPT